MKRAIAILALALCGQRAIAQTQNRDTMIVMTVPLKHISAADAVQLLFPYATTPGTLDGGVMLPGGSVFPVPGGHAITIRERLPQYGRMLSVLREYDRPPRDLVLTYVIVFADKGPKKGLAVNGMDSLFKGLPYTHYVAKGAGAFRMSSQNSATLPLDGFRYRLRFDLHEALPVAEDAPVRADVAFTRDALAANGASPGTEEVLLSAKDVTIPFGQTVLLGSKAIDRDHAVILVLRPEKPKGPFLGIKD